MIWTATEGMTAPLVFRLKYVDENGVIQNLDTAGMTITLNLYNDAGTVVDTAGDLTLLSPSTSGLVRYTPDAADFVAANGPYTSKFKVVDGGGAIDFFPRGEHDVGRIYKP